ncbi:MAG: AIPR family protein [Xanthobacteraceae bacterium]
MSQWDIQALQANFENWRKERAPQLPPDKAFERYVIELVLRNLDLTDEEIEYGWLGGADDGGIDGFYFLVNRTLIQDDSDVPTPAMAVDLILFQAKNKTSFEETPVEKMHTFIRDLLDYSKLPSSFSYYSKTMQDAMTNFREKYTSVLGTPHHLSVTFVYATKSDNLPNTKIGQRANSAKTTVQESFSAANVSFVFFGCQQLLGYARATPRKEFVLEVFKHFSAPDKSVVCLVKLSDYAKFLTDENGEIRKDLLEPNVRDYQGKRNPVNADIRSTLATASDKEFWWLNNGVTILAENCTTAGDKLTIKTPEIVNGLQTSQEVFAHFKGKDIPDSRHILIRILVLADEPTRNRVVKATNFQTAVEPLSLRATEQVHFDIEERLKLYDLYYDRRKGKYRNALKPIVKIISIRSLAQALIAIVLQRPNDARGGPQKLLSQDAEYTSIFSETMDRDLYVVCALLDKQVENALEKETLTKEEKRDVRYYADMLTCCNALKAAKPTPKEIVTLLKPCREGTLATEIKSAVAEALKKYKQLGATDKVAKGPDMNKRLLDDLSDRFPALSKAAKNG